jgi:hypothetical protein
MRCLLETGVGTDEFPINSATLDHRGYMDYKFLSDGRIMGDEAPARSVTLRVKAKNTLLWLHKYCHDSVEIPTRCNL